MPKFLILLSLALTAYAQMQERVAIIQTLDTRDSVNFTDLAYLTDRLRETAVKVLPKDRFGVMTTESMVAFLGSEERAIKVCKEASCLAEIGRKVNADYVAQGHIGRFGNDLTIKVELYNSRTGNLMDSFTGYSKDIYGLLALIEEKAPEIFKNMSEASTVKNTVSPPTAVAPTPTYVAPSVPPEPVTPSTPVQPPPPQQQAANMEPRAKVQWYINKGFEKYKEDIQKEALSLSYIDKTDLYDKNKKGFFSWSAVGYAALNTVPGFGLGNYMQGDMTFGIIQSILDGTGCASLLYIIVHAGDPDWNQELRHDLYKADVYVTIAFITLTTSRIVGLVIPFVHQNKLNKEYNKSLYEALNGNSNVSYSIDPLIIPKDGPPAVGLALNLRY